MEKIILAPRQMHKNLLFSTRKEDFFVNPKILTKEEFLDKYYGRVTFEGVYLLFKNHNYIYDNLKELICYIPHAHKECKKDKNVKLYSLKQELENANQIEKDEFFEQFIKDKEIEIYGYSKDDKEIISLLNKFKNPYIFKDFSKSNSKLEVSVFPLLEDEIFYMLNNIASLLDSGVSANDIYIYTCNENAIYYIEKYYESFGFKINFPNSQSIYSQETVSKILKKARETKSFELAFESLDGDENPEIVNSLKELCEVDLPFEKKFDYVSSYIKTRKLQNIRYDNAINIIDSPIYEEGKTIFVPCFAQNIYPKSYKDNGYISDADKIELNVLTSLEKCRIENDISRDFVLSNNRFILSRSSASFSEKYFPSPFVKSLGIEENYIKDMPNKIYSKQYGEYRLGIDLDKKKYFLQYSKCEKSLDSQLKINYRKYDNQYTDAKAFKTNTELQLSYSSAKTYFECPFAYYLDNVLGIKIEEDRFEARLGKLAHSVFEKQFDDNFDFEKVFEEERTKNGFSTAENLLVDRLKKDIKEASDASILHYKSYAKNPKYRTEAYFQKYITPKTKLVGFADKIIILDDSDAIVVDYKTGNDSFDRKKLPYGLSMQLPTYAYLLGQDNKYKDLHIAGLYINNVINKNYSSEKDEDDAIDSYLKLNGITVANQESAMKIDESLSNGKSFFIKGLSITKKGEFKSNNSLVGEEELKQMINDVLNKYLEADKAIRNNEYPISPLFLTSDGPCKFCKHADICFLRGYQKRGKDDEEDEGDEE